VLQFANAKVSVPTLAFAGLADGAADAGWYDRTERFYTGPYEIVRVAGAGHFLHREAPGEFADKLLAFLGAPE
ncbi:MAG: alpha/beta hydrolase, partial [Myxococcales bacterium]|nr:alpha/beta hydrolase [Myxococcales bacterium]